MLFTALIVIGLFIFATATAPFWINWLWFGSMGYRSVIVTNYLGVTLTFLGAGLLAAAIFLVNIRLAQRNTRTVTGVREGRVGRFSLSALSVLGLLATVLLFITAGWYSKDFWRDVWLMLRSHEFGVEDPTYHRDVSFYVFTLPVLHNLQSALMLVVGATMVAVAIVYLVRLGVRFGSWGDVPFAALRHLSGLGACLLLLVALGYVLRNFDLVFSQHEHFVGPGFTETNIVRPLNWLMAFLSAATAIGLLSGVILRNPRWLVGLLGGWALLAALVTPLLPLVVQQIVVDPNDFSREEASINRNMDMTLSAYGLNEVVTTELTGQEPITAADLPPDQPPLSNVRIWDYRVVGPVYQQQQSFVPYYEFSDVDVEYYTIDGQPVQVLLSPRELNVDGLPSNARTWTNRHLAYTHGYGVVVSPVSEVNSDNWPVMMVGGVPPTGPQELAITRPEIYFGELPQDWIIVNTDQPEFTGIDESMGEGGFQGEPAGSISLGNPFTRGLAALTLGDRNVFISGQLNGDSRLVLTRSVIDRAERIAPFIEYDPDPYMVIADGQLYWVIDGYTSTDRYPHATGRDGINYLRNSVKVVINAYDGTTTFYRTAVADPIADAYGEVYGDLFTPVSEAPASISRHFRYPERQFNLQSSIWSEYHVETARALYDGDDQWIVAEEELEGQTQSVEPYFVTQRLPNETETEFALTVPFTPGSGASNVTQPNGQRRQNMTAWFAGTADESGQTRLRLYRYPRQVTVDGPLQVEAQLIATNPEIREQISLWNQSGTDVIYGNMLVIPVNDAMLYIQPVYLQASSSSAAAPKLVRVIVANNDRAVMRATLPEAIEALTSPGAESVDQIEEVPEEVLDQATPVAPEPTQPSDTAPPPAATGDYAGMSEDQLATEALAAYDRAQAALAEGDWTTYGEEQQRLGEILEALTAIQQGTPVATPGS
jgi:uncharacterized membrane protein (UPF0182 family)